jgi:hypothetical protein
VPDGWFIRETEWEAAQTICLWRDARRCTALRGASVEKQGAPAAAAGAARCCTRRAGDDDDPIRDFRPRRLTGFPRA